jgi:hypothetical protein
MREAEVGQEPRKQTEEIKQEPNNQKEDWERFTALKANW